LVFQILGGYLGDRCGPRKVLTICSLIWAGATILTGLVGGFVSMVAARLLRGSDIADGNLRVVELDEAGRPRLCPRSHARICPHR
jgi:MFS family permease